MLRIGSLILSVWCWLNVLPAVVSLWFIARGQHAPGLRMRFTPGEIPTLDSRTLAVVDGLATLLNTLIAVYCVTCFFMIRAYLVQRRSSTLYVFGLGVAAIQVASYIADRFFFLGTNSLLIHISSLLLFVGISLCAADTQKRPNQPPEPTAMSVTPPAAQEPRQP